MSKTLHLIAAFAPALLVSGCFTMNADLPGTLRADVGAADTEKLGTVTIEKGNNFLFWGLVGAPPRDFFAPELQQQVSAKGGDGAANLVYEAQHSVTDALLGCVTCGILSPRSYKLTADIVKIHKGALPGNPPKSSPVKADAAAAAGATTVAQNY